MCLGQSRGDLALTDKALCLGGLRKVHGTHRDEQYAGAALRVDGHIGRHARQKVRPLQTVHVHVHCHRIGHDVGDGLSLRRDRMHGSLKLLCAIAPNGERDRIPHGHLCDIHLVHIGDDGERRRVDDYNEMRASSADATGSANRAVDSCDGTSVWRCEGSIGSRRITR